MPQILAGAATITGTKCAKAATTKTVSNIKYTCIKQGSKLVWNKGVAVKPISNSTPKPTSSPSITPNFNEENIKIGDTCTSEYRGKTIVNSKGAFLCKHDEISAYRWFATDLPKKEETPTPTPKPTPTQTPEEFKYSNTCDPDPEVPAEWAAVQNWALQNIGCARPYRYVQGPSPKQSITKKLQDGNLLSIETCKLDDTTQRPWGWQRFGNPYNYYRPTISAITQVIPVQFSDLKAESNPSTDYGKYIKFYSDYLINSSDVTIKPEFRVPNHYFQVGFSYTKYNLGDGHKPDEQFIRDLEVAIRSEINLNGVNQVLLLLPPDAKYKDFDAKIPFGNLSGTVFNGMSMYLQGPIDSGPRFGGRWNLDPWITAHEMFGHLMGLDDHFGAELFNRDATMPADLRDLGTGNWGMMSGINGDFLVWDKWTVGWVADTQIKCVSPNSNSTIAISPNTTKSNLTKAVVIPLSGSRGIVIESQRSTGYNYKFPTASNGALVYVVEMKEMAKGAGTAWAYGEYVQRPANRPAQLNQNGFALGDATLKMGESIIVEGIKISVVEAGDFGDVVQVEKN